uniref:Peptidase_M13 domain-containing protein n=1 Tax=Steinernema glaseri TaxID=37863 RepID=A0A1I7YMG0_9BILA
MAALLLCAALLLQLHGVLGFGGSWKAARRGDLFVSFPLTAKGVIGTSPGYHAVSTFLLNSMNQSVDPCDDFYEYACGNYGINNDYDSGRTSVSTLKKAQQDIYKKMIELYKDRTNCGSTAIEKVKIAFRKCIDESEDRVGTLLASIREAGGWPLLDSCTGMNHNLTSLIMLAKDRALLRFLIEPEVKPDVETREHMLKITFSLMDFPGARNYKEPKNAAKQVKAHKDYIYEKVSLLKEDLRRRGRTSDACLSGPVSRGDIDDMFALEQQLFRARRNPVDMTLTEADALYPEIRFLEIIEHYGGAKAVNFFKRKPSIFIATRYIDKVMHLWKTKKRTVVNYIFWRYMKSQYLDKLQLRGQYAVVPEIIAVMNRNKVVNFPVEEGCSTVLSSFPDMPFYATSALYARKYVSKEMINEVKEISTHVRAALEALLKKSWLTVKAKDRAFQKLSYMKFNIGYPEWIMNNTALDEYYKELQIENSYSYSNIIDRTMLHSIREGFNLLGTSIDRAAFQFPAHHVNAAMSLMKNAIEFPAGLLHDPMFGVDYPRAVNFGTIGATLAHEMTHAFDSEGCRQQH